MSDVPIRILLVSGSMHHPSHTLSNLKILAALCEKRGAKTHLWDLAENPLPIHNPIYHRDPHTNESDVVRELAQLADESDGFVWGTPVYHNSFSGVLKNAIDNLSIRQFRDKPVALVSNGGDRTGVQPCDQLRIVTRGLLAVAIPAQIITIESDFELRNDQYILVNSTSYERFTRVADELMAYSKLMRQLR